MLNDRGVSDTPIRIAVTGFGYWGPNIVRKVTERHEFELAGLCELDPCRAAEFSQRYPNVPVVEGFDELIGDPSIDAVAIATPPQTHCCLAEAALRAGKHVLVEKPLATTVRDAKHLAALAADLGKTLMPGHTFLYSPAVLKIKRLIDSGELGDIYFITSSRMNLGLYQHDGVISDLASHDFSILLYWLEQPVTHVSAIGHTAFQEGGVPETAFITIRFEGGVTASVQVSWLAPRKLRQTVIVGSKGMIEYDDTSSDEPVRMFDRGMGFLPLEAPATFGEYQLTHRTGDVIVPRIDAAEPLSLELADFAHAIRTGAEPRSNARFGVAVVETMEAAQCSMSMDSLPLRRDTLRGPLGGAQHASHGPGSPQESPDAGQPA